MSRKMPDNALDTSVCSNAPPPSRALQSSPSSPPTEAVSHPALPVQTSADTEDSDKQDSATRCHQMVSFFSLSAELRNEVYLQTIIACGTKKQHHVGPAARRSTRKVDSRLYPLPSLALANQQAHNELSSMSIPNHEVFAYFDTFNNFHSLHAQPLACTNVSVSLHISLDDLPMGRVATAIVELTRGMPTASIHVDMIQLPGNPPAGRVPGQIRMSSLYSVLDRELPRTETMTGTFSFKLFGHGREEAELREIGAYL